MSKIILVNNVLHGCLGEEKVLWNYMLEGIPDIAGVDQHQVPACDNWNDAVKAYIDEHHPDCQIIIQNATFIPFIDDSRYSIVYLQDNLRAMNRRDAGQDSTLTRANRIVTNSILTTKSYPEHNMDIISIGIDEELFKPVVKSSANFCISSV